MGFAEQDFKSMWNNDALPRLHDVFSNDQKLAKRVFVGRELTSRHIELLFGDQGYVRVVTEALLDLDYQSVPFNPVEELYSPGARVLFIERAMDTNLAEQDYQSLQNDIEDTELRSNLHTLRDLMCNREIRVQSSGGEKVPMLDALLIEGEDKSPAKRDFTANDILRLINDYVDCALQVFIDIFGADQIQVEKQKQQQLDERRMLVPALMGLVQSKEVSAVQSMLAEHDFSVNVRDDDGNTLFMVAVGSGDLAMTQTLLGHCPHLDEVNHQGEHALMQAVRGGDTAIAKLLMDMGADMMTVNQDHENALILAVKLGDVAMAALLLEYGASVYEGAEQKDSTALSYAHERGDQAMIDIVLSAYLRQSLHLANNSNYDIETAALLRKHEEGLCSLLQARQLGLAPEGQMALYRKLLHPAHALGRIFWQDREVEDAPEIIAWLEGQLLQGD
jgi:hypothetical protein